MTRLPPAVHAGVDAALNLLGHGPIRSARAVSGGSINRCAGLVGRDGASWFLKWNESAPEGMFEAEADGLRALAEAADPASTGRPTIRVPRPLQDGQDDGIGWLLMEWVEVGATSPDWDERLGRGLATLHRGAASSPGGEPVGAPRAFGWPSDNWIGSLPQANHSSSSWGTFWRDRRIVPQLDIARRAGHLTGADVMDRVVEVVPRALADVDDTPPALLHGDLWSGNALADATGAPVLVDPAVYRGHGEVDLAMTELFGGFGDSFYRAYDDVSGIPTEYGAYRRALYQLYYLLVHVNLFGEAYAAGARGAARTVVEAWA